MIDKNAKAGIAKGGIESINLIPVEKITNVEYDDRYITKIEVDQLAKFVEIPLSRGKAIYSENAEFRAGMLWVEHILEFTIGGINTMMQNQIEDLALENQNGVVAIVVTNQKQKILVGFSKKLKLDSALRFKKYSATSACTTSESPEVTFRLSAVDGERAMVVTEQIESESDQT